MAGSDMTLPESLARRADAGTEDEHGRAAGERLVAITIPAQPDRLRLVRATVGEAALASGCSEGVARDIVLAVDEACQNIIKHAYRGDPTMEIFLDVRRRGDRIVCDVVDFAAPVDLSRIKPRSLEDLRPGGLGIHFIRECMDEIEYPPPPKGAGNCLRMVKRIA